jgi:glycine/D-amino acid oxidase-like deaminating enzyme
MANDRYDLIVIGTGAIGSAALWQAARRGLQVLGLDRFPPGHDQGSSHGRTRIIRQAYFEHPDYVPLLLRTYELWAELEQARSERLFHQTGLLQVGPADGHVVSGVLKARVHGLDVESLRDTDNVSAFAVADDCQGVFEHRRLRVERCVVAQAAEGQRPAFLITVRRPRSPVEAHRDHVRSMIRPT